MRHRSKKAEREMNERSHEQWRNAGQRCLMEGIATPRGAAPHYCQGRGIPIGSHTIPANVIRRVSGDHKQVVAFVPRVDLDRWSPRETVGPAFPDTPVGAATVGRYACAWHDQWFNPIDTLPYRLVEDSSTAMRIALRATSMAYFLAERSHDLYQKRSDYCQQASRPAPLRPQECGCLEQWEIDHKKDRERAEALEKHTLPVLAQEVEQLVDLARNERWSEIVANETFLPGQPSMGGTALWRPLYSGDPITLTIIPESAGHRIFVTHHRKLTNVVQGVVGALMGQYAKAGRTRLLSEIALQQHHAMFILKPKWESMSASDQEAVKEIVKEMGSPVPPISIRKNPLKWLRSPRSWPLREDPRVPDLFSAAD